MAGKSSKPKHGNGKGKGKGKGKHSKKKAKQVVKKENILSLDAMVNAYYICNNVSACLFFRGFSWPGSTKKKRQKRK